MKTTTKAKSTNQHCVGCLAMLAAATVAFAPQPAWAKGQVPFSAAFDTQFDSVVEFPIAHVQVKGKGNATHLGLTAVETTNEEVNLLTGAGTATMHFTAANGDEVVMEFVMIFLPTPAGFDFTGTWEVTGGTGRFAGAEGSGTLDGWANFTDPTSGVGHFAMTGTISSPGSLK